MTFVVLDYSKTMAGKILTTQDAIKVAQNIRKQNKKIVLAGGCFDILHVGHIVFLKEAKKRGDTLFLLLESDASVKKRKGKERPVNPQEIRARALLSLNTVDYIIALSGMTKDDQYDRIIIQIKPDVIAQTEGDPNSAQRLRQCKMIGAKLAIVTKIIGDMSTTKLLKNKI